MPRDLEREHDGSSHPVVQSQKTSRPTQPSITQANRERLLRRVRSFWITGVLEQSLHGAALLALGLHEHPDAVANPWHLVLHHPHTSPRPLPTGTRITQVYDEADGELLILGAPGCGKTTLLLELARDLLSRAEREEQHPLPIIFNLSSWAMKQAPLVDWLVEELVSKYQVPRKLGQALVDADQILPLLDGLDEVAPSSRMACIEMINTYREEHGWLPLVVCSRSVDYLAQTARLQLGHAVAVQPLTEHQVDDYLASGGEAFWALRLALRQDAELRELTSTPLMLSILMLAYHNMPVEDLLREASQASRQRQIFERYVERMLTRRRIDSRFSIQKTIGWLSWLARQMKRQNQTQFSLEQLQPAWMEDRRAGVLYRCVLLGLPVGLFSSLFAWLYAGESSPHFLLAVVLGLLLGDFLGW